MAKQKDYVVKTADGRMTIQMLVAGADGRVRSTSCPYPYYEYEEVEHKYTNADGEEVFHKEWEMVKKTRTQTVQILLKRLSQMH